MKIKENEFGFNKYANPICYGKTNNETDEFSLCIECAIKTKCERENKRNEKQQVSA